MLIKRKNAHNSIAIPTHETKKRKIKPAKLLQKIDHIMKHVTCRALRCNKQTYSTNNILCSIYAWPAKGLRLIHIDIKLY